MNLIPLLPINGDNPARNCSVYRMCPHESVGKHQALTGWRRELSSAREAGVLRKA